MISNSHFYLCSDLNTGLDFNYRYQVEMPIFSQSMKKGHPITKFDNYKSFSSSMLFNEQLLVKLIGIKLSCQTGIDDNFAFFKGTYRSEQIIEIIKSIVIEYILCKNCDRPEVELSVRKNQLYHKCKACGTKYYIQDNGEKIYETIKKQLKNN